jgi:ABC-type nitrate/sulfonate/bicarbonate transport system permease component
MIKRDASARLKNLGLSLVGFVAIICLWQLLVVYTQVGRLIPSPLEVVKRFVYVLTNPIGSTYTLPMHLLISLRRVLIGYCLAVVAGVLVGIGMGRFEIVEAIVNPIFQIVRPIPGVAWIPMAIVWFGIGETAKLYIIFMSAFVNIVVNTYAGAKRVDANLLNCAKMLGANETQSFFRVVIPSCVPYIFAGLQVGLSTSWMGILAAEMVAAREGIGWIITAGQDIGDMTQIFVGIIAIAVIGLALATFMRFVEKVLCRWRVRGS